MNQNIYRPANTNNSNRRIEVAQIFNKEKN
jgi:Ca2+-binding EF-hand superfamily protein